jgi:hypothetical protein
LLRKHLSHATNTFLLFNWFYRYGLLLTLSRLSLNHHSPTSFPKVAGNTDMSHNAWPRFYFFKSLETNKNFNTNIMYVISGTLFQICNLWTLTVLATYILIIVIIFPRSKW